MNGISTHVQDVSRGLPAPGIKVTLSRLEHGGQWTPLLSGTTDAGGRVDSLLPAGFPLQRGAFRLHFETASYFAAAGANCFHPYVEVVFTVSDPARHHHVPLLLSAFGYTTFRGA